MVCFAVVLYFLFTFFKFCIKLGDCVFRDIKFMRNLPVQILLFFEFFIILFVFFCDSLNFVILLRQNWKSIIFKIFYFLFKSSFDVLPIRFVYFSFGKYFLYLSLLFFKILLGELFFLFDKLDSMIIFIYHGIIFHLPFGIESLKFFLFLNLLSFNFLLKVKDFAWHLEQCFFLFSDLFRDVVVAWVQKLDLLL